MDNTETVTLLEWCAGYAGIGLGLKRIFGERLRTIGYSELEGYAIANLISKMEQGLLEAAPIWTDIKTFPCQEFRGLVDIFSAGYPCQPFSAAGKRLGEQDPRHLWPFIQRAIRAIQPRYCFFENVRGHLTLGFKNVCHDLAELGYTIVAGLFTAREVGAWHRRERLYILAHNNKIRLPRYEQRPFQGVKTFSWSNDERGIEKLRNGQNIDGSLIRGSYDGPINWMDRLALCGNGVVPQTAELAFRTLYKELEA